MEDHRTVSVSRVYVPNEYTVYLSTADRAQFADYEARCASELQEYLAEHARREGYALLDAAHGADRDRRRPRDRRVRHRDAHGAGANAGAAARPARARRPSPARR